MSDLSQINLLSEITVEMLDEIKEASLKDENYSHYLIQFHDHNYNGPQKTIIVYGNKIQSELCAIYYKDGNFDDGGVNVSHEISRINFPSIEWDTLNKWLRKIYGRNEGIINLHKASNKFYDNVKEDIECFQKLPHPE